MFLLYFEYVFYFFSWTDLSAFFPFNSMILYYSGNYLFLNLILITTQTKAKKRRWESKKDKFCFLLILTGQIIRAICFQLFPPRTIFWPTFLNQFARSILYLALWFLLIGFILVSRPFKNPWIFSIFNHQSIGFDSKLVVTNTHIGKTSLKHNGFLLINYNHFYIRKGVVNLSKFMFIIPLWIKKRFIEVWVSFYLFRHLIL